MLKRGRPPHPDILTPREWEVRELLRQGLSNRQVAERLGISLDGAKYHVSEILGKLGVSDRQAAAAWTPSHRPWWAAGSLAFLAWPFKSLLWGSTAKVAAAAAVAATVVAFAVPEGFGILVTDPDVGPIPDYPNFSYVTAASQVPLTDNPAWDGAGAWSPDCSRIAFTSNREGYPGVLADFGGRQNLPGDVYVMNSIGTGIVNLTRSPGGDEQPAWSPDGTRIAFSRHFQGNSDIYAMNSDGTGQTNLTNLAGLNRDPAWSSDGERILFTRFRELASEVYVMNSDGTGQTNLTQHPATDGWASWSLDGKRIAFASNRHGDWEADPLWLPTLGTNIYTMNADGGGVTRLTNSPSTEVAPRWSPDGKWISFTMVERQGPRVYVMKSDGTDVSFVVEGHAGHWSSCEIQDQ